MAAALAASGMATGSDVDFGAIDRAVQERAYDLVVAGTYGAFALTAPMWVDVVLRGVHIAGGSWESPMSRRCVGCEVSDCEICDWGRDFASAVGVLQRIAEGTKIVHNHIHDVQVRAYGGWGVYNNIVHWDSGTLMPAKRQADLPGIDRLVLGHVSAREPLAEASHANVHVPDRLGAVRLEE